MTPEDQATLVLLWQATQGIFDALLITGLAIVAVGLTALSVAMLGTPAFGKGFGWLGEVLGVLGIAAGVVLLIDPGSPIAARATGTRSLTHTRPAFPSGPGVLRHKAATA